MAALDPLHGKRRVVLKVGSSLLVGAGLKAAWLASLAADIAALRSDGVEVVVVSSGSIALGRGALRMAPGALPLELSQAAAAVGSIALAQAWRDALLAHGIETAQILLTLEDSEDRRRYLNLRSTLNALLDLGAVPIVNENDTVATDEIRYGDNDRLAAQVAVAAGAEACVLLSDVDGLYTANPSQDPAAVRLDEVREITPAIEAMAGDAGSGLSKGGMRTKVLAARTAVRGGCDLIVTDGRIANPVAALRSGGPRTVFVADDHPASARLRWIAAMKPRGRLTIDAGAQVALDDGRSLLPAGVVAVEGSFGRGDPVEITGPAGPLARGLSRYTAEEAARISGLRSDEVEAALGYPARAALVHRDDMTPWTR
ncbi:glutamate 5-kinase [Hasllibacter halocynthiae]|uniref:Glutamate 5-kinase n=1 Tax=Hasllibacter halocynthiae TaxID=595589 RepID=A0A2T0X8D6_9RHOB|nr:glutamate 5-kinase [Hasllibacter halocynthiae]PRY95208.1 glutamate 5-kinase [Hasllibacter halocynthiae]